MSILKKNNNSGDSTKSNKNLIADVKKPITRKSRNGIFSAASIAIAIAIVLIFNIALGQIPESLVQFDMSQTKIYDLSDTTLDYLNNLDTDVTITVVAEKDSSDDRIVKFLDRYVENSDHLTLTWVDPVAYPSALTEYNCEENTIIVSCETTGESRQISFDDILIMDDYYYYYYGTTEYTEFDGEGQLLSAIDYVLSNTSHTIYCTENHGESDFGTSISEQLDKNHFTVNTLSLLQTGSVPEDCDVLVINTPTKDFSSDEITLVENYLNQGGKVQLIYGDVGSFEHPNIDSLLKAYNLAFTSGYIGDTSRYYPAGQSYFTFFPEIDFSSDMTESLSDDALALVFDTYGLNVLSESDAEVESVLYTDSTGVMLEGEEVTDVGSVVVAKSTRTITADPADATDTADSSADTSAESDASSDVTATLTVYTESLLNDSIISQFGDSVANQTIYMNDVTSGFDDVSNISIDSKSLETPTNTVSNAGLWGLVFVAVFPLGILAFGTFRWLKRRKL